jgi:hypothetical protein
MKDYSTLLKDPRWQRRRLEILQRSDFSCEECGDNESTLHVHHRIYRKGAMPWEYQDHELQALCEHCHAGKTLYLAEIKSVVPWLSTEQLAQLCGYCQALCIADDCKQGGKEMIDIPCPEFAWGLVDGLPGRVRGMSVLNATVDGKISLDTIAKLLKGAKTNGERSALVSDVSDRLSS